MKVPTKLLIKITIEDKPPNFSVRDAENFLIHYDSFGDSTLDGFPMRDWQVTEVIQGKNYE